MTSASVPRSVVIPCDCLTSQVRAKVAINTKANPSPDAKERVNLYMSGLGQMRLSLFSKNP